jgi:hypothetical protein
MYYGSTTQATDFAPDDWNVRLFRAAFWFIPRANPDFEPLFVYVRRWLVEVDDSGRAQREVALGNDGTPLFAAPNERNCGFWTDSDKAFLESELVPVSASEFEQSWSRAYAAARTPNNSFKGRRAKRARP